MIDVRRHNAGFCREHFIIHIHNQVARTIKEFEMFEPEDRILVAVSGGKDSLALWDILLGPRLRRDRLLSRLGHRGVLGPVAGRRRGVRGRPRSEADRSFSRRGAWLHGARAVEARRSGFHARGAV